MGESSEEPTSSPSKGRGTVNKGVETWSIFSSPNLDTSIPDARMRAKTRPRGSSILRQIDTKHIIEMVSYRGGESLHGPTGTKLRFNFNGVLPV